VNTFHNVSDRCAVEVATIADASLRMYAKGSALTLPCDGDVERFCGSLAKGTYYPPGQLRACLHNNAGNVTAMCWALLAASLKDDAKVPWRPAAHLRACAHLVHPHVP
jgi:hypothetical protein